MKSFAQTPEWFSTILSHIGDAVIGTDPQGAIIFINKAAEQLTGWSEASVLGHPVNEIFTIVEAETRNRIENPVSIPMQYSNANTFNASSILIRKDKAEIPIEYQTAPTIDHDGNMHGIVLIFRDKSERKNSEEELKTVKKELEAFSHTISHDMRAPLRAIKGYASILEEDYADILGKEVKSVLDIIQKNVARMDVMIEDLVKFSKLGKEKIVLEKVNVEQEVKTILTDLLTARHYHVDLVLQDLPPMLADRNMVVQVWTNLLSNAIKFTSKVEEPKIEIGCQSGETEVIYYVKDNGAGFDMKYGDQLFGVFQRLHKASDFEGSGMGLSSVQRIISKHGGRVWAEGEVNAGATFYFALPKKSIPE